VAATSPARQAPPGERPNREGRTFGSTVRPVPSNFRVGRSRPSATAVPDRWSPTTGSGLQARSPLFLLGPIGWSGRPLVTSRARCDSTKSLTHASSLPPNRPDASGPPRGLEGETGGFHLPEQREAPATNSPRGSAERTEGAIGPRSVRTESTPTWRFADPLRSGTSLRSHRGSAWHPRHRCADEGNSALQDAIGSRGVRKGGPEVPTCRSRAQRLRRTVRSEERNAVKVRSDAGSVRLCGVGSRL